MSSLPHSHKAIDDEGSEAFWISPDNNNCNFAPIMADESWSLLYEEMLLQSSPTISRNNHGAVITGNDDCEVFADDGGGRNSRSDKGSKKSVGDEEEESGGEGPSSEAKKKKKRDHNAKERIRRMKLNASYLALRALLPSSDLSRKSKKRWSAPAIVDRVLKYIPELEAEVQALKSQKQHQQQHSSTMLGKTMTKNNKNTNHIEHGPRRSVSVNKVSQEEAVVQICISASSSSSDEHGLLMGSFVDLMESVEESMLDDDEGLITIRSASTVCVCCTDDEINTLCCHFHIQINQGSMSKPDCIEQVISRIQAW